MNPQEKNTYVKKQITKALINLMSQKKITDISISEICDKAAVGRSSFYRNYYSKEEVIEKYTESLILSWAESVDMDPNASIYNFFARLFEHFQTNSSFYKILYDQKMSPMILGAIRKRLNITTDTESSTLYLKVFTAYGIFGWIDVWFSNGMKESPEELNTIILNNLNSLIQGAKTIDQF